MTPRASLALAMTTLSFTAAGLAAPSANALTVAVTSTSETQPYCDVISCTIELRAVLSVSDPVGADNDVTLTAITTPPLAVTDYVTVSDGAGAVTAGAGCEPIADGKVRCALPQKTGKFRDGAPYQVIEGAAFDLGAGNDTLRLNGSPIFIGQARGGAGNDALVGTGIADTKGTLTWDGGAGADTVTADRAVVSYADRTAPVTVTAGDGANDGAQGEGDDIGATASRIIGGSAADQITGAGTAAQTIDGGDGDDQLAAGSRIEGGAGNDQLVARPSGSIVDGGAGNDRLTGGAASDTLDGGTGADVLQAGGGDDFLSWAGTVRADGGEGNDSFSMGSGDGQIINGGPGTDVVSSVDNAPARITLDGRANDGRSGQRNNLVGIESVFIRHGVVIGSSADERLSVDEGSVYGRGGADNITGSRILDGGSGRDTITAIGHRAVIRARDGQKDALLCGQPRGTVFRIARLDRDRQDTVTRCVVAKRR